jgi:hypothetical protein
VFGFRPVSWLAGQEGQRVPEEALGLLETLFPPQVAWVAGSDAF